MQNLQVIEVKEQRVLTTKQIAEAYVTTTNVVKTNFTRNRKRFVDGKHYISLTGDDLKAFKNQDTNRNLVNGRASHLYLWTEKGALLHAKSLNTDKAWEVYDWLVDFYFRVRENAGTVPTVPMKPRPVSEVVKSRKEELFDVPGSQETQEKIQRINECCIAMKCALSLYNRYLDADEIKSMQKALFFIGAEACSEAHRLKNIKISVKK